MTVRIVYEGTSVDYYVDEYFNDETGEVVPAHWVDMSNYVRITAEGPCPYGHMHAYEADVVNMPQWPQLLDHARTMTVRAAEHRIEECRGVE